MKKIAHKIRLFFSRIVWVLDGAHKAVRYREMVREYEFLKVAEKKLEERLLKIERNHEEGYETEKIQLRAKLETVRKILNYKR